MRPDVICFAEELPVRRRELRPRGRRASPRTTSPTSRAGDPRARRVSPRSAWSSSTTLFMGEAVEQAEKLRDPSHVRNYSEEEWRAFFADAGLEVEEVRTFDYPIELEPWLERTGCTGETAERGARAARRPDRDGGMLVLDRIALQRDGRPDGDPRRRDDAPRRPGPDRQRGPLPRAAQPRLRHERRRRRHARQGRPGRRGHPGLRHGRATPSPRRARTRRSSSSRPASPPTPSTRRSTPGSRRSICITEHIPVHDMLQLRAYVRARGRDA